MFPALSFRGDFFVANTDNYVLNNNMRKKEVQQGVFNCLDEQLQMFT